MINPKAIETERGLLGRSSVSEGLRIEPGVWVHVNPLISTTNIRLIEAKTPTSDASNSSELEVFFKHILKQQVNQVEEKKTYN